MCQTSEEIHKDNLFLQELKDYETQRLNDPHNGHKHIDLLISRAVRKIFTEVVQGRQDTANNTKKLETKIDEVNKTVYALEKLVKRHPSLIRLLVKAPGVFYPGILGGYLFLRGLEQGHYLLTIIQTYLGEGVSNLLTREGNIVLGLLLLIYAILLYVKKFRDNI